MLELFFLSRTRTSSTLLIDFLEEEWEDSEEFAESSAEVFAVDTSLEALDVRKIPKIPLDVFGI